MTYFTLVKGFVCTAILYLPRAFYKGGWGFSLFSLTLSLYLTLLCIQKILECRDAC